MSNLTLYALADELPQLLDLREEMAAKKEDTAELDAQIAVYIEALPAKVDAVAAVLATLKSQAELAETEIDRLKDRARHFAAMHDRLERYVINVLSGLPAPKKGPRKLAGATATLSLRGNGGVEPLDITEESLVPDEYCTAVVEMPWTVWDVADKVTVGIMPNMVRVKRIIDKEAVRKAMKTPCWLCEGKGCADCGSTGISGVPGVRLRERGVHLEVK